MSASATSLIDFVRDMYRQGVPPFRHTHHERIADLAWDMREAALANNARAVADHIRTTRLERLWRVEDWLMFRKQRHPRIARWLRKELIAAGWVRRAKQC